MNDPDPQPQNGALPAMSVVIPLFQEEAGVAALAAALERFIELESPRRAIDVILVDDGSTDATARLLREHFEHRPGRVLLRHPHNLGLGAALETGSKAARSPYISWFDSDLTYDPSLLGELAAALDAGADVALSSCYHPDGGVEGVPGWRLALSRAASSLYRGLARRPDGARPRLHTYTSMVRAYRRETLAACQPTRGGFAAVTEVLLRALRRGARCVEVPAVLRRRRSGQSKMRILRVAMGHFGLAAALCLRRLDPEAPVPAEAAPPGGSRPESAQ